MAPLAPAAPPGAARRPRAPERPAAPPDDLAAAEEAALAGTEPFEEPRPLTWPSGAALRWPASGPAALAAPRAGFGLRGALGVVAALGTLALLVVAGDLLLYAVLGAVLAYLLQPAVNALERRGMGRTAAACVVFFGLLAVLAALTALLAPVAIAEAAVLKQRWADGELYRLIDDAERAVARQIPVLEYGTLDLVAAARRALDRPGNEILGYIPGALSSLTDAIIVPFVMFFLLRDGTALQRRAVALVPNRYFEFVMGVLYKSDAHLGGYLRSQALVALFVGALTTAGLGVVGVSNYAVLGFLTGLLNFVPYVGFFVSFVLTTVVSVVTTGGFGQLLGIAVVFAVAQGLENFALQPWITGRSVSLHPVTVLLAIFIGDRAFGVLGMALAVPATAVLKVIVVETVVTLRRFRL